jgi:3-(3-hydroxy-phenyl)propionate hydroxylase
LVNQFKTPNGRSFDVAIIGMGPVGSVLANVLGQYQISTAILDRQPSAYALPRAASFDDEAMRIFQSIGLSDPIDEITEVGSDALFVDSDGNTLARWERPKVRSPNGWFYNYRFHQPELEAILRRGLVRYPCVTAKWGCEVTGLTRHADGVAVQYLDAATQETSELFASYAVGCDGARSFTRSCINTNLEDLGFCEPWLVIDLLVNDPVTDPGGETYHFCEPERSGSDVFVGAKRRRFEFRLNADDDPEEIIKPDNVWPLIKRWIGPDDAKLERAVVYTFQSTIAERWREGRIMIAGDAAHLTPPFMGQGMCAGIRDAANLGWKLERVLSRGACDSLLDTYESERRPHVREYIALTIQLGQMINRTISAIIAGNATNPEDGPQKLVQLKPTLGPGLSDADGRWCGQLFVQPRLSSGKLLDDEIGNRWAIVFKPGAGQQISAEVRGMLAENNVAAIDDSASELQNWFETNNVNAALLRPDRYIHSTASSDYEILQRLRSAFSAPT